MYAWIEGLCTCFIMFLHANHPETPRSPGQASYRRGNKQLSTSWIDAIVICPPDSKMILKKGTSVMNYWCLFNDCHFICVMVRSFRVVLALSQTRSRTRPGQRATERLRPEPAPEQRGTVRVEDGSHCPKLGERKTCTLYDFICCSSWSKRQKPLAKAR